MQNADHQKIFLINISADLRYTQCKCGVQNINDDSQFSILERADKDVVFLHSHVFVAVRGDDLVAQKQETVNRVGQGGILCACVCVCVYQTVK